MGLSTVLMTGEWGGDEGEGGGGVGLEGWGGGECFFADLMGRLADCMCQL